MQGAAGFVALQVCEVEGLRNNSLAREGGIAVQNNGHDLFPVGVFPLALHRPSHSLHDGPD